MQRKLAAQQIIQRSVSETGTAAIEAENARLKAEIDQAKLRAEAQGSGNESGSKWQEYLLGQMEKVQGQLADTQRALTDQQMAAFQERMEMIQGELQRVQEQRGETPNTAAMVKQSILEARELMELVTPNAGAGIPPPAEVESPQLRAWSLKAKMDHERWQAEREDRRAIEMAKIEMERQVKEAELNILAEQERIKNKFFIDAGPKILDVGERLLKQFMVQSQTTSAAPSIAARPQIAVPQGAIAEQCGQCGNTIIYRPEWGNVICQYCGATYDTAPDSPNPEPPVAGPNNNWTMQSDRPDFSGERRAADEDEGANIV